MDQLTLDKLALRELIENWALWRDAGFWDQFRTVWHDDGRMMATWTQGTADEFIEMNKQAGRAASRSCISSAASPARSRATGPSRRPR